MIGLAVLGLWWQSNLGKGLDSVADQLIAASRITGLVGTYHVLVQVLWMSRLPRLDRSLGTDRMAAWHRANG